MFGLPSVDAMLGADCAVSAEYAKYDYLDPDGFVEPDRGDPGRGEVVLDDELHLVDGRVFSRSYAPVIDEDGAARRPPLALRGRHAAARARGRPRPLERHARRGGGRRGRLHARPAAPAALRARAAQPHRAHVVRVRLHRRGPRGRRRSVRQDLGPHRPGLGHRHPAAGRRVHGLRRRAHLPQPGDPLRHRAHHRRGRDLQRRAERPPRPGRAAGSPPAAPVPRGAALRRHRAHRHVRRGQPARRLRRGPGRLPRAVHQRGIGPHPGLPEREPPPGGRAGRARSPAGGRAGERPEDGVPRPVQPRAAHPVARHPGLRRAPGRRRHRCGRPRAHRRDRRRRDPPHRARRRAVRGRPHRAGSHPAGAHRRRRRRGGRRGGRADPARRDPAGRHALVAPVRPSPSWSRPTGCACRSAS